MAESDEIGPDFRYRVGFEDGLQEGIDLAEHLRDAWRDAGSSKGLIRGAAIIAFLLKKRKEDNGNLTGGADGAIAPGNEAGVEQGGTAGALVPGVLGVADGDLPRAARRRWQASERPTPEERLKRIREVLNRVEEPDGFHLEGYPNQYAALADLYDEDFASELREAVEG